MLIEAPGGGVSINGGARDRANAKQVIETLADRAGKGAEINEADVRAAIGAAAHRREPAGGRRVDPMALPVGKRGAIVPKTDAQARYLDTAGQPRTELRRRPGGDGQDLPGRRLWRLPAAAGAGGPAGHHPPGGRGGREAGLPARRPEREGRSLSGPDLGGAERHPRRRGRPAPPRQGRDRGRAHRLHARPHAEPRLRHRRRGPEHLAPADEDGPDPAGRGRADGGHRRPVADRPAEPARLRPGPRAAHPATG